MEIRVITKIINRYLYDIKKNINSSFSFVVDFRDIQSNVDNFNKLLSTIRNNKEIDKDDIEKSLHYIKQLINLYVKQISNMLICCTDGNDLNIMNELSEHIHIKSKQYFTDLKSYCNETIDKEDVKVVISKKYILALIFIVGGISLGYFSINNDKFATHIGTLVGICVAVIGGVKWILRSTK